jgi:hypothetical protein
MKLVRSNVWERASGDAVVELVIAELSDGRVVKFTAALADLEAHAEKCLQVAREMRRRKAAP